MSFANYVTAFLLNGWRYFVKADKKVEQSLFFYKDVVQVLGACIVRCDAITRPLISVAYSP